MNVSRKLLAILFGSGVILPHNQPVSPPLIAPGYAQHITMSGKQLLVLEGDLIPKAGSGARGRVRIFERTSAMQWIESGQIIAPNEDVDAGFGFDIKADDRTLAVTSRRNAAGASLVRIYSKGARGEWLPSGVIRDPANQSTFGTYLLVSRDEIFITGVGGTLYSSRRDSSGTWSVAVPIAITVGDPNMIDRVGAAMAASGQWLAVGGPGNPADPGKIFLLKREANGAWKQFGSVLTVPGVSQLGTSLTFHNGALLAGAPGGAGVVVKFELGADNAWRVTSTIPSPVKQSAFGSSIAIVANEMWVGAPLEDTQTGAVYRLAQQGNGWGPVKRLAQDSILGPGRFGSSISAGSGIVAVVAPRDGASPPKGIGAVALPGLDETPGMVYLFAAQGGADWKLERKLSAPSLTAFPAVTGAAVPCSPSGKANTFGCSNTELLSFLPVSAIGGYRGTHLSGMWGWTDPVGGRDYALIGRTDGTAFVDVTDPVNPKYLGDLLRTSGATPSNWREIKTYKNYALIISDGSGDNHGVQIFDLNKLRGVTTPRHFTEDAHYALGPIHDIAINEQSGFAYLVGANRTGETCGGGLHIVDVHDPLRPAFSGCFNDPGTGRAGAGFTHDVQCVMYRGPDTRYRNHEICIAANETHVSIQDVTDKKQMKVVAHASYPSVAYAHQGWFSEDQRYWFFGDELDEEGGLGNSARGTRTLVWDLAKLDDPIIAAEHIGPTKAIDHNQFVKGDRLYQSNYTAGLRILDISNPVSPREVGHFDTHPLDDSTAFAGSWSNYPWFRNGAIGVVSMAEGFFMVRDVIRK